MDRPPIIRTQEPLTLPMAAAPLAVARPGWVTVIAVIGICFAVLELLGAIATPLQIIAQRFQQKLFSDPQFLAAIASQPAVSITTVSPAATITTRPTANTLNGIHVGGSSMRITSTAGPAGVATTQVAIGMPPAFNAMFQQIVTPPPWFDTYMISNGVECLIAGAVLLVGSILLLQQRSSARPWLFAYVAISLLWTLAIIVIAAASGNLAFANQAICATACGAPLPIVLIIMLFLPAQREWFARRRDLERTSSPAP